MWVNPLSDDGVGLDDGDDAGVGSGAAVPADGVELAASTTSGDELVDAVVDTGFEESGVLSLSAEAVGDVLVDSAEVVGLVLWLVEDEPYVECFVSEGLVDVAVGDSPCSCVDVAVPFDVPSVDVLGRRLVSVPVLLDVPAALLDEAELLLDDDELLELSEPVPSA